MNHILFNQKLNTIVHDDVIRLNLKTINNCLEYILSKTLRPGSKTFNYVYHIMRFFFLYGASPFQYDKVPQDVLFGLWLFNQPIKEYKIRRPSDLSDEEKIKYGENKKLLCTTWSYFSERFPFEKAISIAVTDVFERDVVINVLKDRIRI